MSSDILTFEEAVEYSKIAKKIGYKIAVAKKIPAFRMGEFRYFKKTEIVKNNQKAKIGTE